MKLKLLSIVTLSIFCISACTREATPTLTIKNVTSTKDQYAALAQSIESCKAYSEPFKHLLTQDMLERRVLGLENGKCVFEEDMPGKGLMRCEYSETERVSVANYYRSIKPNSTFSSATKTPLSEALASGACVVSGY